MDHKLKTVWNVAIMYSMQIYAYTHTHLEFTILLILNDKAVNKILRVIISINVYKRNMASVEE